MNSENAPAYALAPKHALAQYAATGCFGRTFYATAEEQLTRVLELCEAIAANGDTEFVARVAVYSRKQSFMKDMPAMLCAWLSKHDPRLHEAVFARVIDNARMLRTYVQILRSGVVGRKSLGTAPKRLVREWLANRDEDALFSSSAGQSPSLSDIVKMVHPKPAGPMREAFYGYMLGRSYNANALPKLVMQFEQFKAGGRIGGSGPAVHDAVGAAACPEGLGERREERFVADHANEPEHVRPARRVRSGRAWLA